MWGGDAGCEHSWGEEPIVKSTPHTGLKAAAEKATGRTHGERNKGDDGDYAFTASQGAFCAKCGSWKGSLGLEPTPELYISHMVEVFREVKRVLRSDGTLFCNMGDGFQNKQLMGMPWRLAFALQADGWWLRSEIIWHKPNPMPESVRDRPTKAHETVFLLTKSARYFYDQEAVREPIVRQWEPETNHPAQLRGEGKNWAEADTRRPPHGFKALPNPAGRNRRTVWVVPTHSFSGAHFATFPPALIEPMILTSPTKCCAVCGRGWERVMHKQPRPDVAPSNLDRYGTGDAGVHRKVGQAYQNWKDAHPDVQLGFSPACECGSEETVPAMVLDPFVGSGTSIMVALRHARNAVGLELSEEYAEMARRRIVDDNPMFNGR